jgi:alpha-N-arabinofuranosidase
MALYGQFAEHLRGRASGGIYEGVWVGEDSKIPNTNGYRNDVVAALKALKVPLVRWPGGCFADEYHWREGIGPRDKRPDQGQHQLGRGRREQRLRHPRIHELRRDDRRQTYVNGNVGTGTPQESAEWIEYMTSDSGSTWPKSAARTAATSRGWSTGSRSATRPGAAAAACGRNTIRTCSAVRQLHQDAEGAPHRKIASGANAFDYNWTEVMLSAPPSTWTATASTTTRCPPASGTRRARPPSSARTNGSRPWPRP